MTYIITEPCVDLLDRACVEECPVDCIYEGARMLYIHPDECVDCAACEPVCPVEAIFYEDDVPAPWQPYVNANYEFFEDLGSPGGASRIGRLDKDAKFIAALPGWEAASTEGSPSITQPGVALAEVRPRGGETARAMPEGAVGLVFISHRKEDLGFARAVADVLSGLGVPYFLDEVDVITDSDEALVYSIEEGLDRCTHLVGLLTEKTRGSWWVPYEIGGARGRSRKVMYLVYHDIVPARIPAYIRVAPMTWSVASFVEWASEITAAPRRDREVLDAAMAGLRNFMLE